LAHTKDATKTAFEMGNSVDVVLRYYYNWKSLGKAAAEYWALTPEALMADTTIKIPERFVGYPIEFRHRKQRNAVK